MKTRILCVATVVIGSLLASVHPAPAQGTLFTYQGRLQTTNGPANGTYDLTFGLYNAATGGSQFGSTVQTNGNFVTNGLFIVTVDFGAGIFDGTPYWLQIGVRTNGAASFTALLSREQLTPAPYAIYSEGGNAAGLTGTLPATALSGPYSGVVELNNAGDSFSGNGSGLTGVNAAALNGLTSANFWQLTGNAGTSPTLNFLGTPDNEPLNFRVNNARGLVIQPDPVYSIPNLIGGSAANYIIPGSVGNVIAGGGWTGAGTSNYISGLNFNVISGGYGNGISNGYENVIGGGEFNLVGGARGATVPGGEYNVAGGQDSFAAGQNAQALHDGTFVWADRSTIGPFASTGPNQFLVRATNGASFFASVRINGNELFLEPATAGVYANDGLVWGDGALPGGINSADSPFLAGYEGGALGALAPNILALSWDASGDAAVNEHMTLDQANDNAGAVNPGLTFGSASGEGIASQRTAGTNQYSLDFYTGFGRRMTIMQGGFVGIGTTNPAAQLQVVNAITTTSSPGIRSLSGGGQAGELTRYGYYSAAGEFIGANGVIGVGTTNQVNSYGVIGVTSGEGYAVLGNYADANNGYGYGVFAESSSPNGTALYTQAASSSSPALTIGLAPSTFRGRAPIRTPPPSPRWRCPPTFSQTAR